MTTPTPRWTAETEAAATRALWEHGHLGSPLDEATERDEPAAVAFTKGAVRAVLDSLARAGVLTAVGGETRHERSYSHEWDGSDCVGPEGGCDDGVLVQRTVTEWPDGTELTTPWREVTDGPA